MITFAVSDVARPTSPRPELSRKMTLEGALKAPVHAIWKSEKRLVACTDAHPLAQAAHDAFFDHLPLRLSPDAIWFAIAQGFAAHINENAEALRERFVRHEGKKTLVVERPDFRLDGEDPWPEAFAAFSAQIAGHVGKARDLVAADFSTTGPVERAASEVLVMDAFQAYFTYEMRCGCGIPEITLLGTVDDWRRVRQRAAVLSEYGLEAWTSVLLPVLDHIVRSAEGRDEREFWRSFFRYKSGSGGSELTGWIHALFPYVVERHGRGVTTRKWSPYLASWEADFERGEHGAARPGPLAWMLGGPSLSELPSGLASAPVKLVDMATGAETPVRFVGGMFGVVQDPVSLAVEPEFGWAIVHDAG